jgi:para-nitrobenzyl esterase
MLLGSVCIAKPKDDHSLELFRKNAMPHHTIPRLSTWALCAAILSSAHAQATSSTPPVVQTSQGSVNGTMINAVRAYLGIPYAAPPVGELRWQAPRPPLSWSGTRDGSHFGARCAQPASVVSPASTDEDCLFLNVHVPDDIGRGKLPVMVWIHGGAFLSGSGADYDMSTLSQKGRAVVVSINYRLGAFGFLRHPEMVAQHSASNLGLQDQQAALRWVQSQISRFGGDPSRVTVFGQSAGGVSACLHLVSPLSKGLFHRAIAQSGPCELLTNTTPAAMQAQTIELGTQLACPEGPGQLACMRQKSAAELVAAAVPKGNEVNAARRWTPVIDGITLPDTPASLIASGQFNKVPVMFGSTHDEGRFFIATEYHQAFQWPVIPAQFAEVQGQLNHGDPALALQIASTYNLLNYGTLDLAFSAELTDSRFACDSLRDAEALSRHVPTFNYEFTEPHTPAPADPLMPLGAFHGAELRFIFQNDTFGGVQNGPLSAEQQKLADQMLQYWSRFAATGNPNSFFRPLGSTSFWPAYSKYRPSSLALDSRGISVYGKPAFNTEHHCAMWTSS